MEGRFGGWDMALKKGWVRWPAETPLSLGFRRPWAPQLARCNELGPAPRPR